MLTYLLISISFLVATYSQAPFWNTTVPDVTINASAGISVIKSQHYTIYNATLSDGHSPNPNGTFNHGPQIVYFNKTFYASWYNSLQNGNDLFMRVLYSTSIDGISWSSSPMILFPNITANGSYAEPFTILNNRLYGSCSLWTNNENGVIAQMRLIDNNLGEIFWLSSTVPNGFNKFGYKTYLEMDAEVKHDMEVYIASLINDDIPRNEANITFNQTKSMYLIPNNNIYENNLKIVALIRDGSGISLKEWYSICTININNSNIIDINNTLINMRSCRSGNYYYYNLVVIFNKTSNKQTYCDWSEAVITSIPDAPSRTCTATLNDGSIYLIGNQVINNTEIKTNNYNDVKHIEFNRNVLTLSLSKDGYAFNKVYAIRYNPPPMMFPSDSKSIEFGYPSAVWDNNYFYIIYDINKEDIAISIINQNDL